MDSMAAAWHSSWDLCLLMDSGSISVSNLSFHHRLSHLEVGVGEQEEQFLQLPLAEEVRQELHGVGAQARHVLVLPRIFPPQSENALPHVLRDLERGSNLD